MQPIGMDGKEVVAIARYTSNIKAVNTVLDPSGGPIPLYTKGQVVRLPFAIFGYNDFPTYGNALKQALVYLSQACPGINLVISISNAATSKGAVLFTYSLPSAGTIDVLTIWYPGTQLTSYLNMLSATVQKKGNWTAKHINYAINDAANGQLQFIQGLIQFFEVSAGGANLTSEELVGANINPEDNPSSGRVGIPCDEEMSARKAIVDSIIGCPASDITAGIPFVVTYYISKVNYREESK